MLAPLLAAGSSLLGGLFQKSQADKNIKLQKQFAQSGIQWKVEDAKKAGVHPLYALGAQTHSFAPQSVGDMGISNAGQDLSRAVSAAQPQSAHKGTAARLQLENMELQNDFLRSQINASKLATLRQGQTIPMPSAGDRMLVDGQSGSGLVRTTPMARQSVAPGALHQEAGAVADVGFSRSPTGYAPMMSKDAKERLEDDTIGMFGWNVRNRILPSLGYGQTPPDIPLAPDEYWAYNPFKQEYRRRKYMLGRKHVR